MNIQNILKKINNFKNLTKNEMNFIMKAIMNGQVTPAQIGAFLMGLHMKGETVQEIAAAAMIVRSVAKTVKIDAPYLVDIVGTGGDVSNTFNISTTSAFVIAAAGGHIAKHNNRAISSQSGSVDVLEYAGINLHLTPEQIAQCIEKIGIGFMFAPHHHTAFVHTVNIRRELGIRTIFNLLGTLTNPALVRRQLVGVYEQKWVTPCAYVLKELGSEHALVVHSQDGLDEISVAAPTWVAELKNGEVREYTISPEQFGLKHVSLDEIRVHDKEQSYKLLNDVLSNKPGIAKDIILLNAGAAIYVAGIVSDIEQGIQKANEAIESYAAKEKFEALLKFSNHFKTKKNQL